LETAWNFSSATRALAMSPSRATSAPPLTLAASWRPLLFSEGS
jgi:hypothetical protein